MNTGDNLSDPKAVPELLDALGPLMEFPGVYVFGSNDYYGPKLRNPALYLLEKTRGKHGLNGNAPRSASCTTRGNRCATRSTRRAGWD